jgi:YwiC-like protein
MRYTTVSSDTEPRLAPEARKHMSTATIESPKMSRAEPVANLSPKEHGAYAILAIPIVTAIFITGLTLVGLCVAIASIAGFLAH